MKSIRHLIKKAMNVHVHVLVLAFTKISLKSTDVHLVHLDDIHRKS